MMKNRIFLLGAYLLLLSLMACRDESTQMQNYAFNDNLAFEKAENSYAEKFKVLWNGMNVNYAMWDYEQQQGLDWDAVYDKYLPEFEAFDEKDREVSDKELEKLMEEVMAPLHDGHLLVCFKNHQTGNYVNVSPSKLRNKSRDDYEQSQGFKPDLDGYFAFGDFTTGLEAYTDPIMIIRDVLNTKGVGRQWVKARIADLEKQATLSSLEAKELASLQDLVSELLELASMQVSKSVISTYNKIALRYEWLHVPGLTAINETFYDNGIHVRYALSRDNIAYFYLSGFSLSPYLSETYTNYVFGKSFDDNTKAMIKSVCEVWLGWFNAIQQLHKAGALKGIIIDLRSNGGGYTNDFQYVLGSMLPSGGFEYAKARFKRGTGRYDYSSFMPQEAVTFAGDHEVVDDVPIVLLVNCRSVSMSEMSSVCAQQLDNGCVIGKRTWGGFCALTDNQSYSNNYSGYVGIEDVTPVFCYIPGEALFTKSGQALDGVGVTPNIEVAFDTEAYKTKGRDTQLDRALQYIREGQ